MAADVANVYFSIFWQGDYEPEDGQQVSRIAIRTASIGKDVIAQVDRSLPSDQRQILTFDAQRLPVIGENVHGMPSTILTASIEEVRVIQVFVLTKCFSQHGQIIEKVSAAKSELFPVLDHKQELCMKVSPVGGEYQVTLQAVSQGVLQRELSFNTGVSLLKQGLDAIGSKLEILSGGSEENLLTEQLYSDLADLQEKLKIPSIFSPQRVVSGTDTEKFVHHTQLVSEGALLLTKVLQEYPEFFPELRSQCALEISQLSNWFRTLHGYMLLSLSASVACYSGRLNLKFPVRGPPVAEAAASMQQASEALDKIITRDL